MSIETIAIYVRVSTQEQAKEGYSIDEQLDRLRKYCEAHDWKLVKEYIDPGYSGAKLERPSIQQLIKDVQEKKISRVLVYKLDRLSRSQKDTLYLIEDVFLANGTDFVSMCENFDTATPFGRAMIGILSVFAQLEREQIKERMSMGKEGRAKEGKWHGGVKVPIGYRFVDDDLIVDPYEAHIVKTTFQLYADGKSINYIANYFRDAGMKTSYGSIPRETIQSMLKNNVYLGLIKHGKNQVFQGLHDPIIDQKTFDRVQARFERNRRNPRFANSFEPVTVLGGLLRCKCGCTMRIRHGWKKKDGTTTKYYVCSDNLRSDKKCDLGTRGHRITEVQKIVFDEIKKLSLDPLYFIQRIRESRASIEPVEDPEIPILRARIAEIEKQTEKLIRLFTIQNMDFDAVSKPLEELSEEKKRLEETIEAREIPVEAPTMPRLSTDEVIETIKRLTLDDLTIDRLIGDQTDEDTKEILNLLIEKIVLSEETVEIHWNF